MPLSLIRLLFVFVSLFSDILLINVGVNRQVQDGLWQISWESCVGLRAGLDDFGEEKCLASSGIRAPDLPLGTDITAYMDCWVEDEIGELNIEFVVFLDGDFL